MSEVTPAAAAAPATAPVAAAPAAPPPAAAPSAAASEATSAADPLFIRDRLERDRRATLKKLGIKVGKEENVDAVIAEAVKKRDLTKQERKDLRARNAELEGQIASSGTANAALGVYAEAALSELTETQRESVKKIAGADPQKLLETISLLKMTGQVAAPAAAALPPPAAAPPANTAPPAGAPAPAPGTALTGEQIRAQYQALKTSKDPHDQLRAQFFAADNLRDLLPG